MRINWSCGPVLRLLKLSRRYRRDMITLRKSVWPLRELISGMQKIESEIIKDTTRIYLRDIYDHTIQVIDSVEDLQGYSVLNGGRLSLQLK